LLSPEGLLKHDVATGVHEFYHDDVQLVVSARIEWIELDEHLFAVVVMIDKCSFKVFIFLPVES